MKSLTLLVGTLCLATLAAQTQAQSTIPPYEIMWIDRAWEYRYVLIVGEFDDWDYFPKRYAEARKNPDTADPLFRKPFSQAITAHYPRTADLEGYARRDAQGQLQFSRNSGNKFLGISRIDFDREGRTQTPNLQGQPMQARLNELRTFVLTPLGEDPPSYTARLGDLFMGSRVATDENYSPALCHYYDDTRYAKASSAAVHGYFGCREWAYQLYNKRRPYIDVTSYERVEDESKPKRNGKHPLRDDTFIKPFIGFARFEDAPKPVIGSHLGTWFCLNDCPGGAAPGKIDDIKAWAKANGWPVPKKPKDVYAFRDSAEPDLDE